MKKMISAAALTYAVSGLIVGCAIGLPISRAMHGDLDHQTLRQCMADAGTAFCSHRRICHGFGGSGGMETGKADIRDGDHRDDQ